MHLRHSFDVNTQPHIGLGKLNYICNESLENNCVLGY